MYQSGKNSLFILKYVTTKIQLSVFFSMYQSRYNYLCIHKYVSIQIQLSLYSWVCINPDTTRSQTLYSLPRTNSDCNQTEFIFIYLYFGFNVIDWLVLFFIVPYLFHSVLFRFVLSRRTVFLFRSVPGILSWRTIASLWFCSWSRTFPSPLLFLVTNNSIQDKSFKEKSWLKSKKITIFK